ncbi:terminase small subunit [Gemmobacter lutimaris]|uniref:Terminase small subunit n=1 Tax=Gemmobacter lutimaris TaxID=2306023 RepID=A0A398BL04_9RHOB|nr:terminase small subunit [Gemmobacter lutimaris]RID91195.1 terminase small subunit [Gemmobacter lutimaris]
MAGAKRPLNDKQRAFAKEYLIDLNATQAAIRAGYSERTAGQIGYELLKKPEIQAEIVSTQ